MHCATHMMYCRRSCTAGLVAVTGVNIAIFADKPSRIPWLRDVSDQIIPQLLVLAKLAYDGTNEDQLIFHGPSGTMETLGTCRAYSCVVCTHHVYSIAKMQLDEMCMS